MGEAPARLRYALPRLAGVADAISGVSHALFTVSGVVPLRRTRRQPSHPLILSRGLSKRVAAGNFHRSAVMSLTLSDAFFIVAAILFVIELIRTGSLTAAGLACVSVGLVLA